MNENIIKYFFSAYYRNLIEESRIIVTPIWFISDKKIIMHQFENVFFNTFGQVPIVEAINFSPITSIPIRNGVYKWHQIVKLFPFVFVQNNFFPFCTHIKHFSLFRLDNFKAHCSLTFGSSMNSTP